MKDAFPRNKEAEEWRRSWIRGTSAVQQTSLRKKEFFVECLGETGCGTEKTEPREVTPHIETGATESLAREALRRFSTLLWFDCALKEKKDFGLRKKCRLKNNFLRTRVSVDPSSLQSHKQTLLSGTTQKACCPTAQVTSSTRKFPKTR